MAFSSKIFALFLVLLTLSSSENVADRKTQLVSQIKNEDKKLKSHDDQQNATVTEVHLDNKKLLSSNVANTERNGTNLASNITSISILHVDLSDRKRNLTYNANGTPFIHIYPLEIAILSLLLTEHNEFFHYDIPGHRTMHPDKNATVASEPTPPGQVSASEIHPSLSGHFALVDGANLTEMVVDKPHKLVRHRRAFLSGKLPTWPNGTLHYVFDENISSVTENMILYAIKIIKEHVPCVHIIPATEGTKMPLIFVDRHKDRCFASTVGYNENWSSLINVNPRCHSSGVIHEILHVLGSIHEQSRPDRDEYLHMNWDNIQETYKHNFVKFDRAMRWYDNEYDPKSVMQYRKFIPSFAFDGSKPVFVGKTRAIDETLPRQYNNMVASDLDWESVKSWYGCGVSQWEKEKKMMKKKKKEERSSEKDYTELLSSKKFNQIISKVQGGNARRAGRMWENTAKRNHLKWKNSLELLASIKDRTDRELAENKAKLLQIQYEESLKGYSKWVKKHGRRRRDAVDQQDDLIDEDLDFENVNEEGLDDEDDDDEDNNEDDIDEEDSGEEDTLIEEDSDEEDILEADSDDTVEEFPDEEYFNPFSEEDNSENIDDKDIDDEYIDDEYIDDDYIGDEDIDNENDDNYFYDEDSDEDDFFLDLTRRSVESVDNFDALERTVDSEDIPNARPRRSAEAGQGEDEESNWEGEEDEGQERGDDPWQDEDEEDPWDNSHWDYEFGYEFDKHNQDCLVSPWSEWSDCEATHEIANRHILHLQQGKGRDCPTLTRTRDCRPDLRRSRREPADQGVFTPPAAETNLKKEVTVVEGGPLVLVVSNPRNLPVAWFRVLDGKEVPIGADSDTYLIARSAAGNRLVVEEAVLSLDGALFLSKVEMERTVLRVAWTVKVLSEDEHLSGM